jgi:hypothetical protein
MNKREYRGKIYDAKKRLVANNYRAIEGFILRDDVLVEHWSLQSYGEDIGFDKRTEDELLSELGEKYPFLQFTLEDGVVRWTLGEAR